MNKTMKRQIGYKPDKKQVGVKLKAVPPKTNEKIPVDNLQRIKKAEELRRQADELLQPSSTAKEIVDWIKSHPLIAWGRLCELVGIDAGNFNKILQSPSPSMKPDIIFKIETALKPYGYSKEK